MKEKLLYLSLLVTLTPLLAGCGRMQAARPAENPDFTMTLTVQPEPPVVGQAELLVTLADVAGRPVEGARIQVEGTMTHAGMKPELGEATGGQGGRYLVPLNWTMSGDWVVTVTATLPDGRVVRRQSAVRVGG